MKHVAKALLAATVVASGLAAAPAAAQLQFGRMDTGLYLGGSVGGTHFRHFCNDVPAGVDCDDGDVAGRAFAGWQFNRYVGLELGLAYLGKAELSVPGLTGSVRARSADLVGVFSYPIRGLFAVYGKAGLARNRLKGDLSGFVPTTAVTENSTNLTYGAGVRYNFTRNFAARAEWQRYHVGDDNFVAGDKIDFFSLGLLYGWY